MKKKLSYTMAWHTLILVFQFASAQAFAQDKFSIIGKISSLTDGTLVDIKFADGRPKIIVAVTNGVFTASASMSEPTLASISTRPDWDIKNGKLIINYKYFFLENGHTEIIGTRIGESIIKGGSTQNEFIISGLHHKKMQRDSAMLPVARAAFATTKDSALLAHLTPFLQRAKTAYREAALAFIKENKNSYLTLEMLMEDFRSDSLFNTLSPKLKNSVQGKKLAALLIKQKELAVGKVAPNFILPDVMGNPISLASYRGKYILVDFWASWCKPCREENPNLVKAYATYKNKNFEILSISVDKDKKNWLKAVKDDGLAWTNMSDFKGFESSIIKLWGIQGVPKNFLLNPKGVIIATDLHGEILLDKLEKKVR